jgi:hypothetical protein
MQSFEEDATKVLFEFTARSVMSPFHTWIEMQLVIKQKWKDKEMERQRNDAYLIYRTILTSCPRQLAKQKAVSMDQIFTRRSSEPVTTYLPERSNIAAGFTSRQF